MVPLKDMNTISMKSLSRFLIKAFRNDSLLCLKLGKFKENNIASRILKTFPEALSFREDNVPSIFQNPSISCEILLVSPAQSHL